MNRKNIYDKSLEFSRGRWLNIVIITMVISFIVWALQSLFGAGNIFSTILSFQNVEDPQELINAIAAITRKGIVIGVITGIITTFANAGLDSEIMLAYKEDRMISVNGIIDLLKNKLAVFIVAALSLSAINFLLGFIPIISFIIVSIVSYMTCFYGYIIAEGKATDGIDALKQSYNMTRGHKLNLFLMDLYYMFRPLIGLLVMFVGLLLGGLFNSPPIAALLMIVGAIVLLVLLIKYLPFTRIARAIYYSEITAVEERVHNTVEQ